MKTFNVIFTGELQSLLQELTVAGVIINKTFETLKVVNVSCEDATILNSITQIGLVEEEQLTTPELSAYWHQLRVNTKQLPMRSVYTPKNTGDGVIVYVVDSGINKTHPQFTDTTIIDLYTFDGVFSDTVGHGTAVTSLIAGNTLGISPNVTIKNVKIPSGVQIPISELLVAFDTILADHLQTPGVKVVNCSWHVAKSQLLDTKISELQDNGLVVVAAAGNQKQAANNYSPVGLDSVIGVAASDAYDRVINWGTNAGSNWGPEVDITAPGIDVSVAYGVDQIIDGSGTSYAAAVASGLIAQYICNSPELTASEIKQNFILAGVDDVLFRNESIYGTTPNLMVQSVYHDNIFVNITSRIIPVKRGETATKIIEFVSPATSINIQNVMVFSRVRIPPTWVTLTENNELIATPPVDVGPGVYRVFVEALNIDNESLMRLSFAVAVYENSFEELDMTQPETYYTTDSSGTVVVRLDACNNVGCDFGGNDDGSCSSQFGKGYSCGCDGPFNCAEQF